MPFTQTPSANLYDGNCGLIGVTGEFYRIMTQSGVKPIYTASDAIETLKGALKEKYKMADDDIERFVNLFEDIFFDNNALNVVDTSFFVFAPLKYSVGTSAESKKQHPGKENYRSGQFKIAHYYASMAEDCSEIFCTKPKDLFNEVVWDCLQSSNSFGSRNDVDKYFILPFVKKQFTKDFQWLMSQRADVIVKYLPLFLHFYICFSLMQTLVYMNRSNWSLNVIKPKEVTFSLTSEAVSKMADCIRKGWSAKDCLPESFLGRLSSYAQALDILNCMFEEEREPMTFQDIRNKFLNMEFDDESKVICESVLNEYQRRKNATLEDRKTETNFTPDTSDITVESFDQFMDKLLNLCINLQSKDYNRLKRPVHDLFKIKMRIQRKEYKVLALDDELLLFLIALVVGSDKRIRMDELYCRFKERYGIVFSFNTRNAIADYLQKLNLLERKSDSGEAQYVHIIL